MSPRPATAPTPPPSPAPRRARPAATGPGGADATRRHIVDAAAAAFAGRGYTGVSMNEIVREAGLTKGGVYFHFASKEALALAVVRERAEQWIGRVTSVAMRHERAIDQLASIPPTLVQLIREDPSLAVVGRLCAELEEQHPELAPEVRPAVTGWIRLVASLIRRAQDEGDVRRDLDPEALAAVAVAAFDGLREVADLLPEGPPLHDLVQSFAAVFLRGIAADPS